MKFTYDDGGRTAAGFEGKAGDCVVRSIAIASGLPYRLVYDELFERSKTISGRSRVAMKCRDNPSPRNGTFREVYEPFLFDLGFVWEPTMQIGSGCNVHLRAEELPPGTLIARLSRHLTVVIDGVIHDTHDPGRNGTRCVYGIYQRVSHWRDFVDERFSAPQKGI